MMNNKAISASGLLQTGQRSCHDPDGRVIPCQNTGQHAEFRTGQAWPEPRFESHTHGVLDRLTNLLWRHTAELAAGPVRWNEALAMVIKLNADGTSTSWRLPNINELESLVDCAGHQPALPAHHPFVEVQDIYWSSTTSLYEPDWAWALYMDKGAVGVGQKRFARFYVWAVTDAV